MRRISGALGAGYPIDEHMTRSLTLFSVLLVFTSCAQAAAPAERAKDVKAAHAALVANDYVEAYRLYRAESAHNPLARFMLGVFDKNGWGRKADPVAACRWFESAAAKRIATAEHEWGECLAKGIVRAPDIPAALEWYAKAAGDGHLISDCNAADYYLRGEGVAKDTARGLALCTRVAMSNSPPAMLRLAHYFEDGTLVAQDLAAARSWYGQAASYGMPEAQFHLGMMLAQGAGGDADRDEALRWLETAAGEGYAPAYLPTAILYGNAPVKANTGALAPEHLAKIYLWSNAAMARAKTQDQLSAATGVRDRALSVMPPEWRPQLDRQVAAHLTAHPALTAR